MSRAWNPEKIKFEPKPTQLGDIFQSVITELTPLTRARNITIQSAFADAKLPEVFVDPDKIRQVIMNLVSNAIKYTSGRGKIELFYERHPNELVFNIKDNGIGIPKDQQHKVFNKFFRADNVMKVQTEGSGLGLYTAERLLKRAGDGCGSHRRKIKARLFHLLCRYTNKLKIKSSKFSAKGGISAQG